MAIKTILVVDDEPRFRFSLTLILKSKGYDVIEASNGLEALRKLSGAAENQTRVDLIITDIKMPGMDGVELLETVHRNRENFRAIVMTGYGDRDTLFRLNSLGIHEVIHKPFDADHLLAMVGSE